MIRLLGLVSGLLIGAGVAAQDVRTFSILNAGQPAVCADLIKGEAQHDDAFRQWLLGFWSGMNVRERSGSGEVGGRTSATGIVGEVGLFCEADLSVAVDQAAFAVCEKMKAAGK